MFICITGTPGAGKTTLARRLARRLDMPYIDLNQLIRDNGLYESYDRSRRCYVVDEAKFAGYMEDHKEDAILDSHMSHFLPKSMVSCCIVCRCDLGMLNRRLIKRGYNPQKIRDNLNSEIFEVCLTEAQEQGHRIFTLDCTSEISEKQLADLADSIGSENSTSS